MNVMVAHLVKAVLQAAKFLEQDKWLSEEEKQQAQVLKVSCCLNCAACKLKLEEFRVAVDLCSKVCKLAPLQP